MGCFHRPARGQRVGRSGGAFRSDANQASASAEPGGDPADQSAATYPDQDGVDIGTLAFDLCSQRPLSENRVSLIEGMNRHGAGLDLPLLAGRERVVVAFACNDQVGIALTNSPDLGPT